MTDFVVRSRRAVLPAGEQPAAVVVQNGRIAAIDAYDAWQATSEDVDLGDLPLLPGLVDTHVHVNEPGRTEWEGFATATESAAKGGVTTIVDMPLNSVPPTTTVAALEVKRRAAEGQCHVDVGFWGGAVPGNRDDLHPLHEAGVFGFKCFLLDSGVEEFPPLIDAELRTAMRVLAPRDALMIVHAEDAEWISGCEGEDFGAFVESRPGMAEWRAVERVIAASRDTGCRAHIVHLSAAESLILLGKAPLVSAETCPHYLFFAAEEVPAGATQFKSCPPIRSADNREALWEGLEAGAISGVVSDHSPCTPELKKGDFGTAWGGIASLQLGLPVIWTLARRRGHSLRDVVGWMAEGPADLVGMSRKGRIAVGADADLVAFDPDENFVVDPARLAHRHPVTPYAWCSLSGVVKRAWLRGREIDGEPRGRLLRRGET